MSWRIEHADPLAILRELPDTWAQTCVTSPPRARAIEPSRSSVRFTVCCARTARSGSYTPNGRSRPSWSSMVGSHTQSPGLGRSHEGAPACGCSPSSRGTSARQARSTSTLACETRRDPEDAWRAARAARGRSSTTFTRGCGGCASSPAPRPSRAARAAHLAARPQARAPRDVYAQRSGRALSRAGPVLPLPANRS